jgi:excisionase family DNA binding protein
MRVTLATLTPAEAAAKLAVSPSSVRRWARSGALRAVRVGGRVRIEPSELDRFVRAAASKDGTS